MPALRQKLIIADGATPTGTPLDTQGGNALGLYLRITAVGATPTATLILEASPTGGAAATDWVAVATMSITGTAVGTQYVGKTELHRYLRMRVTANTNVTAEGYAVVGPGRELSGYEDAT